MTGRTTEETPLKLQDQAYQMIRRSIVFLHYRPGEKLALKDLSDNLGVGRTPVRESLVRLQQEGLVLTVPQSGTYVTQIDLDTAESQRFIREQLERQISIEACALATPADINAIDRAISLQETALAAHERGDFLISDNLMHQTIFEIANRRRIWDWLAGTNADLERYRWLRVQTQDLQWDTIMDEHRQLRDAIVERNPTEVGFLVSKHLHMMFHDRDVVMSQFPDYFRSE